MKANRLFQLRDLLYEQPGISLQAMQHRLEASAATVKRMLKDARDSFDMPIRFDREMGGYRIDASGPQALGKDVKTAELPGLWFAPEEALALITAQHLLADLEPGLLEAKLRPLRARLEKLLESGGHGADAVQQRIRITHAGKRSTNLAAFQTVASATLARKRLRITHVNRERNEQLQRDVSPQQLVHYRDNWYLDAWCHKRDGLRSFGIDAIESCAVLDLVAQEVPADEIKAELGMGYGIFGGQPVATARLKFTPERARWVSREQWHPDQRGWHEPDGSYVLEVPYSDDRELVGDILRSGDGVVVLAPEALRGRVQKMLLTAAMRYA